MSSEELSEVLKFIEEREQKLSGYTDKLRQALDKIFQVFGDKDVCQICDFTEEWHRKYYLPPDGIKVDDPKTFTKEEYVIMPRKEWEKDYFGKTHTQEGKEIFIINEKADHTFKPKIEVSIDFDGEPFFKNEEEKEYKLAVRDHKLVFVKYTEFHEEIYDAYEISRQALKEAIKTGAITKFLKQLAEELDKTSKEYEEVSIIAEKLANAV
jgi:hypothetical protein